MSLKVLETSGDSRSVQQAYEAARLLHSFLRLVLVEQTGRGYKLPLATKQDLFQRLDSFMTFLSPRTLDEHRFHHELLCCREAIICMSDTNTLPILATNIIKHILSPGNLITDVRLLIVDIPSLWYVTLLQAHNAGQHASSGQHELDILQQLAATESDWRFRFGVTSVFVDVVIAAPVMPAALLSRWLVGESGRWRVARVGYLHLLPWGA